MPAAFTFTRKSSKKSLFLWKGILEPLILVWTDLRISNDKRVLSHVITTAYGSPSFLESLSAKCFKNIWHSTPIPPFVPKTSGVKVPISTSNIRCWYFLFFSFSCSLNIVDVGLFWLHLELTCVTRTSKNAVTPCDQNPPAFIYNLASASTRPCDCGSQVKSLVV